MNTIVSMWFYIMPIHSDTTEKTISKPMITQQTKSILQKSVHSPKFFSYFYVYILCKHAVSNCTTLGLKIMCIKVVVCSIKIMPPSMLYYYLRYLFNVHFVYLTSSKLFFISFQFPIILVFRDYFQAFYIFSKFGSFRRMCM